jgi:HNH endonuclease
VTTQQYDLTKPPKNDAERLARFNAAFKLECFTRADDGTVDAHLIRRSTGEIVGAPKGRKASTRVDPGLVASFYQIKLALHIGRIPRPQTDHHNRDWRDHRLDNLREATPQENSRNKRTPQKKYASLPKGVAKERRGKDGKTTTDYRAHIKIDGRRKHLGRFSISKHGKPSALRRAKDAAAKARAETFGEFNPSPRRKG